MYARNEPQKVISSQSSTRIIEITRGRNGYGFTLSGQSPCFVGWIVKFSPAEKIGLSVGDYVISVNGKDVSTETHEEVVRLIGISGGTLFLGVSKTLDVLTSTRNSIFSSSKEENTQGEVTTPDFSRMDKVLEDLYSGVIFQNIITPPGATNMKNFTKDNSKSMLRNSSSTTSIPDMVMRQSIVAYLGTVEMPLTESALIPQASLDAIRGCVQQLRVEQHIHQRVLLKVTQSCVRLSNADGDTIAVYKSEKIRFSALCPDDGRFFCIVTGQDIQRSSDFQEKTCCHIFMVDPAITSHSAHEDKAKRFGIACSTNECGDCSEFPNNPKSLLSVIRLLYMVPADNSEKCSPKGNPIVDSKNLSVVSSSTLDSGIADNSDDFSRTSVHIVDYRHSNLTRGESSLPLCTRIAWTSSDDKRPNKEQKNSTQPNDDQSRLNPRSLFSTEFGGKLPPKSNQGSTSFGSRPSSASNSMERRRPMVNQRGVRGGPAGTGGGKAPEKNVVTLNQQNLIRHENQFRVPAAPHSINSSSRVPPPMNKLSMGKYRKQDLKPPFNMDRYPLRNEGDRFIHHRKKNARFFPNRFAAREKGISRSTENVAVPDDDVLGNASSVESLSSNASLPSCINGLVAGTFDYNTSHRSSLRGTTATDVNDVAAGRISHWAVSFERLLDDPLGVKYFKEFLRKEFSEENILFWEACENLRRFSLDDREQLKQEIMSIYNRFMAADASMPVNIDSRGQQLAEEALSLPPHPDVFHNQQHQVYTLMRLDSYSRFLKSNLYRQCMVSEMEGRPLPLDNPDWSSSDQVSQDSQSYSQSSRTQSDVSNGTFQRKSKKLKGSKKGIFGFKNRSKSAHQRDLKASIDTFNRQTNRDSSGSESGVSGYSPVTRTSSLPSSIPDFPDPSRVCRVTLWDNTSTVLYAKRSGSTSVADALETLCQNRGVRLSAVDVYLVDDYAAQGEGHQRRPLSLDLDVSILASQSIVIERRALFRLDMLPVKRSVGVKARPTKSIAEVLRPVLHKYNLRLEEVQVKASGEGIALKLDEPVSTLDALRIVVDKKNNIIKKDEPGRKPLKDQPCQQKTNHKTSNRLSQPDRRETEELINLMSVLQSSKMDDQRGLLSKSDLELPDFLKIKPIPVNLNSNNNNNNKNVISVTSPSDSQNGSVTSRSVEVSDPSPYAVTSVIKSLKRDSDASNDHPPLRRTSASGNQPLAAKKCYVELNAAPRSLSSFKPSPPSVTNQVRLTPDPCDDLNDTTIVEEPESLLSSGNFDPDLTLKPLPTPPPARFNAGANGNLGELPMADFSPPTPLTKKTKTVQNDKTIMV
ncbi:regulator of G-protein signaling 12-like [Clavelina lepadiformis]|uniref:regulator of G-protein signaling 12-like n=1 Tax=Clavelina lepadiformis TaxID=159417 RepID=UPI0040427539